jgi:hypothetical protein
VSPASSISVSGNSRLGRAEAHTSAFEDNPPSLGVSRSLGYLPNGARIDDREGKATRDLRFVLDRASWTQSRRGDITIDGLERCREFLGVSDPA